MRWTWPSWLAVALGAVAFASAVLLRATTGWDTLAPSLLLGGLILVAAGLHALQVAWSDCDYGCGCGHCEDCAEGCCGECECCGPGEPGASNGSVHQH